MATTQSDLIAALAGAVDRAREDRRAQLATDHADATWCIGCGVALDDDNAAVSCTEHPVCLVCDDPLQSCRDCSLERARITTDHADDRAADQARGTREVNR